MPMCTCGRTEQAHAHVYVWEGGTGPCPRVCAQDGLSVVYMSLCAFGFFCPCLIVLSIFTSLRGFVHLFGLWK